MEDIFKFADDLGPLKVIHVHEPSVNLKAILVVDNIAKGPQLVVCAWQRMSAPRSVFDWLAL